MLVALRVSKVYWAEALNRTCYTQNRTIVNTRLNKSLYEVYKGRKLSVCHLYAFGCICYTHNNGKS